jgi:hypothetical protein
VTDGRDSSAVVHDATGAFTKGARAMRRTRSRTGLAISAAAIPMIVVALAGSGALPATASVLAVSSTSPPQGYTTLDRHGCPIYHEPTSGTKVAAFGNGGPTTTFLKRGQHCVTLPATVFTLSKSSAGGCDQLTIVQIAYPKGIGPVAAVVYSTIGLGTRWWEQPVNAITGTGPGTGPGKTTGFGDISYRVPKGYYAWQVGGGAGGSCGPPPKLDGSGAWGITVKYPIRGKVTLGCTSSCTPDEGLPVAKVNVSVDGPTTATATTDDRGRYLVLVRKGSYRVAPELPGWKFDPGNRSVDVKSSSVKDVDFMACGAGASSASGLVASATGTWKFTGTGCLSTVKVTYSQSSGAMTVGWFANSAICDNPPGPTVVPGLGGPEIPDGTPVPANLITKTPTHITAKVNSSEGVLEMDVDLRADGSSGTADLHSAAFVETITSGTWEGHSCRPGSGTVTLKR